MTIKEKLTDYILKWSPVSDAVASPRQHEVDIFMEALLEITEMECKLKIFVTKAGTWQAKFTQCKAEVSILRQRKAHYKREFLKLKNSLIEIEKELKQKTARAKHGEEAYLHLRKVIDSYEKDATRNTEPEGRPLPQPPVG